MNLHAPPTPRPIAAHPSRADLLAWIRAVCPDLRIRKGRLANGGRACWARFTFGGDELQVEAKDVDDPDDIIVRRCAWLLQRRLGIQTQADVETRSRLELDIMRARQNGNVEQADRLALELVMSNEGRAPRAPVRARWER